MYRLSDKLERAADVSRIGPPGQYGIAHSSWRTYQPEIIALAEDLMNEGGQNLIVEAPTGCHPAGQGILMWDGTTKKVEDIVAGDFLMGPDSRSRFVKKLVHGYGPIYKVQPVKGRPFYVNADHILTLQRVRTGSRGDSVRKDCKDYQLVDVRVMDYLEWPATQKHIHKLLRVAIDFHSVYEYELEIDPYFMGVYLGDGSFDDSIRISKRDPEIVQEIYRQADKYGLRVSVYYRTKDNPCYTIVGPGGGRTHYIAQKLTEYGLRGKRSGEKFIPHEYKVASMRNRQEILAGLLDTDGHLSKSGFDYISKSEQLANDVAFVARSLGLAAYVVPCEKYCQTGGGGIYYRVSISGDLSPIPTRVARKQAGPRKQIKSVLRTGFTIEPTGREEVYYGFVLDGDGRYLLDDFTVTHNSGKSAVAVACGHLAGNWTGVTITTDLQAQYRDVYGIPVVMGKGRYSCVKDDWCQQYREKYNARTNAHGLLEPTVDECKFDKPQSCSVYATCPYYSAKSYALAKKCCVLNVHYAYLTAWWREKCNLLVIDEMHKLPEALASLNEEKFTTWGLKHYNWLPWPDFSGSSTEAYKVASEWLQRSIGGIMRRAYRDAEHEGDYAKIILKKAQFRADNVRELATLLSTADSGEFHIAANAEEYIIRPVSVAQTYKRFTSHTDPKLTILMSATIGDPMPLARDLGLPLDKTWFHSIPSEFPPENRPVYLLRDAPKLSSKSTPKDWQRVGSLIRDILADHENEKGIIHVSSWRQARDLIEYVGSTRLQLPDGDTRTESVRNFKHGRNDMVIVSPSWQEGLDFPDDDARFCIIAKIFFAYLGDPVVAIKLRQPGGKDWYDWRAAIMVVQAAGRIVRHENDTGKTYIIDGNWNRVARHAPKWFGVQEKA